MFDKMKDMWELKKKADELKKQLESIKFTSEDSISKVEVNASLEILSVQIKDELSKLDKSKLEKSILNNLNSALKNAQIEAAKKAMNLGF